MPVSREVFEATTSGYPLSVTKVSILIFLKQHPDEAFTASEIQTILEKDGVSVRCMISNILRQLERDGYVERKAIRMPYQHGTKVPYCYLLNKAKIYNINDKYSSVFSVVETDDK